MGVPVSGSSELLVRGNWDKEKTKKRSRDDDPDKEGYNQRSKIQPIGRRRKQADGG